MKKFYPAIFIFIGLAFLGQAQEKVLTQSPDPAENQNRETESREGLIQELGAKDKEIEQLKDLVDFYQKKLKRFEETSSEGSATSYEKIEAAHRLWQEAWNLQRTAVFKKLGREKEEMLDDAIEKFRQIVALYPQAQEADEAQYRIGKIYEKFIKNHRKAKEEFEKYLDQYPRGKFVSEAQEELKISS